MTLTQGLLNDIFKKCINKKLIIIAIESCTGGMLSGAITDIPGSSKVFDRGLITYSNESKIELLGVSKKTIETHGAVSREVVCEMAVNLIQDQKLKNRLTIATSGVAGPDKSEKKPVGLVWIASYKDDNLIVKKINFGNCPRHEIRQKTVFEALKLVQENLDI